MAKVWRRKRRGHEIGSFYVLVDGKPVNLQTQNAREANARARLALAGDWPPGVAADDAAAAAAPLEHADAQRDSSPSPTAEEVVPENPPVVVTLPTAGGTTVEPDPMAAAAAAASDAASAPADTAQDDAAEMRQALRELVSGQGQGGEPVDLGEVVAALQLGCEHAVASMVVARMKPPREIPPPQAEGLAFRVLAIGWRCQLRRWENVLDDVSPAHLILAGTVASIAGLLAAAKKVESKAQAAESTGAVP